jgi:hypothetical protein
MADIQPLFEQTVTFYQVLGACNLSVEDQEYEENRILLFPNPATSATSIRFEAQNEWVKIEVISLDGRRAMDAYDGNLPQGMHTIPIEIHELTVGEYLVTIQKASGNQQIKLLKVN